MSSPTGPVCAGISPAGEAAELVTTLRTLPQYRADLFADRVCMINRMRDLLVGICPALEQALDYSAPRAPSSCCPSTRRWPACRIAMLRDGTFYASRTLTITLAA